MLGLYGKQLLFSFNLMNVNMRSWLLPLPALEKDLVFALLLMNLKPCVVRMNCLSGSEPAKQGHSRLLFSKIWWWREVAR